MAAPPGLEGARWSDDATTVGRRVATLRRALAAECRRLSLLRNCPGPLPMPDEVYRHVLLFLPAADLGRLLSLCLAATLAQHRRLVQNALAAGWMTTLKECRDSQLPVRYAAVLYRTSAEAGPRWVVAEEALMMLAKQMNIPFRRFTVRRTRFIGLVFPNPWPVPRLLPWARGKGLHKHYRMTLALPGRVTETTVVRSEPPVL